MAATSVLCRDFPHAEVLIFAKRARMARLQSLQRCLSYMHRILTCSRLGCGNVGFTFDKPAGEQPGQSRGNTVT